MGGWHSHGERIVGTGRLVFKIDGRLAFTGWHSHSERIVGTGRLVFKIDGRLAFTRRTNSRDWEVGL